jgi:hypothetical protein
MAECLEDKPNDVSVKDWKTYLEIHKKVLKGIERRERQNSLTPEELVFDTWTNEVLNVKDMPITQLKDLYRHLRSLFPDFDPYCCAMWETDEMRAAFTKLCGKAPPTCVKVRKI